MISPARTKRKTAARLLLGSSLITAGISHLTFARKGFRAQVPNWVPLKRDDTVVYSGYVEMALGLAFIAAPEKYRPAVGKIGATFFAAVFPGNWAQYKHHRSALGLDSDTKRFVRLFFQPALIYAAVKSTESEPAEETEK